MLGPRCRYIPTCSQYSLEAIHTHGAVQDITLAAKSYSRCHPSGRLGYDPVPAKAIRFISFSKSILKCISLLYPFVDVYGIKITLTFWGNGSATMGQDCNSRSHVVITYLLILAWQKDYGHNETQRPQKAAVVSHEVSADLPNGQTATAALMCHKQNSTAQRTTESTAAASQQLIQFKLTFIILGLVQKVVILFVFNYSIMIKQRYSDEDHFYAGKQCQTYVCCTIWFKFV